MIPKTIEDFTSLIARSNVIEVLGVAKILNVNIFDQEKNPRDANDILAEMLEKFGTLNRTQKRNLIRIMRAAQKVK